MGDKLAAEIGGPAHIIAKIEVGLGQWLPPLDKMLNPPYLLVEQPEEEEQEVPPILT